MNAIELKVPLHPEVMGGNVSDNRGKKWISSSTKIFQNNGKYGKF